MIRKKLTRRDRIRRVSKTVLLTVLLLAVYFVVGACAPFLANAETGGGSGDPSVYRGDGEGVERATVITENEAALAWRLRLIEEAEEEILLTTYQYKVGQSSDLLGAAFLDAADRGVRIRILVDGLSGATHMAGEAYFEALSAHPNIEIRVYNRFDVIRPWTVNGRLHEKCFVVDDVAYIVGGRNTHDGFLGSFETETTNYDREVLVYNTANRTDASSLASVHALRSYVLSVWEGAYSSPFDDGGAAADDPSVLREYERIRSAEAVPYAISEQDLDSYCRARTYPTDRITLISGETHIYGKEPLVWSEMKQIMLSADARVYFQTPYIMCSRDMYADLEDIAAVVPDFRMITNSIVNTDNRFSPPDYLYHQDEILETGVSIYEFDGEHSTHAKTVLVDEDLVLMGSFNVDPRSTYMNTEIMIVIDSEELNGAISSEMEELLGDCAEVSEENGNTVDIRARETSVFRRVWWYVFGIILRPFRFAL